MKASPAAVPLPLRVSPDYDAEEADYGASSWEHDAFSGTFMLRALAVVMPGFYACYFLAAGVLSAAFGTAFTGTEPFDHIDFNPAVQGATSGWRPLVTWLSMILTMTLAGPWLGLNTVCFW